MAQGFDRDPANRLEDEAHVSGDEGKFVLAVRDDALSSQSSTDGDYQPLVSDSEGRLWASAKVDSVTSGAIIEVQGDVAHDSAAAGNPVLVGASAETPADSAPANRVSADGDVGRLSQIDGALYTLPFGPQLWAYHVNGSAALTDTEVHASPGSGLSLYVGTIVLSTSASGDTALSVFFEEGSTTVLGPFYLSAVPSGAVLNFNPPRKITANTALTVTTSAAIAHSIDVTGYVLPG